MPTSGVIRGHNVLLYVDDVPIAHATSVDLTINTNMIDITSKDSQGWKEILADVKDWSISHAAMTAYDATYGIDDTLDAQLAGTELTIKMSTDIEGDIVLSGKVLIDSQSISNPDQDKSTFDFSAMGNGALAKSVVPAP
jgi:predicted secreted protein